MGQVFGKGSEYLMCWPHIRQVTLVTEKQMEPNYTSFIPFLIFSLGIAITGFLLAREKGRNVAVWTIVGLIPLINFVALWFFIGATNLNTERKLDQLLRQTESRQ